MMNLSSALKQGGGGRRPKTSLLVLASMLTLGASALSAGAEQASVPAHKHKAHAATPAAPQGAPLTPEEQAAQVLNRFTFGPRPGEVAQVARLGWETWFEQQLNPSSIPNPALDKRLAQYPSLLLPPAQLAVQYPDGQQVRRVAEGKAAMPQDPQLAAVYEVLLARYARKRAEDKAAAGPVGPAVTLNPAAAVSLAMAVSPAPAKAGAPQTVKPGVASSAAVATPATVPPPVTETLTDAQKDAQQKQQKQQDQVEARMLADQVLGYAKNLRMQAILKLPVPQRMVLAASVTDPEKSLLTNDMTPHERELFSMMGGGYGGSGVIGSELQQAKVLRAVLSERQLEEVMTDFWLNHFNIDLSKSGDELNYAASYERDAIRAHALGKFRDLLLATAEHPAMLIYLDNWLSIGPDSAAAGKPRPGAKGGQPKGLNENYGREVMELHTVGVDGGYSQADVTNLARILTGWTVDQPQQGGGFVFQPRRHEPGAKVWFGQKINEDGMNEGVRALSWLARQPQTAHFLSYELAQRFVADAPPPAMVDRMAAAYLASDGDIRVVLRAMVHSPEFFSRDTYRTKVKMPLEYVASSLRATGTDPTNPGSLTNELRIMGEPLYRCLPPTGYAATADHWMNSAALVDRLNYALQLTSGKFGGMRFDASRLLAAGLLSRPGESAPGAATRAIALRGREEAGVPSGQEEAMLLMERLLVPGTVSEKTNAIIRQQLETVAAPQTSLAAPQAYPVAAATTGLTTGPAAVLPGALPSPLPDPADTLDKLAAMILGSPEFQVH
ncbi:MAG TPA: DUF1800 family protein [Acidobacteriaceae bacterium]